MMLKILQDSLRWKKLMSTSPLHPSMVIVERQRTRNSYVHSSSTWMLEHQRRKLAVGMYLNPRRILPYKPSWLEQNYHPPSSLIPAQAYMPIGYSIETSQPKSGSPTPRSSKRIALRMTCILTQLLQRTWRGSCAVLRHLITRLHHLVSAK